MKVFIKNVKGLKLPVKANADDAAYDIVATTPPIIVGTKISRPMDGMDLWSRITYIEYGTNVYMAPQDLDGIKYHIEGCPRSSISKYNLVLANSIATLDNGYRGQVFVRFKYVMQPEDLVIVQEAASRIYCVVNQEAIYQEGDKIIQIKVSPNINIDFEIVDDLNKTDRNTGGFGSSDKK